MDLIKYSLVMILAAGLVGCSEDNSDDSDSSSSTVSAGDSINTASDILGTTSSVASSSAALASLDSDGNFRTMAGLDTDTYCNENGEPRASASSSSDMDASSDDDYAAWAGYCQVAYNALSPDTVQGAMYLGGGIACIVGNLDLFSEADSNGTASATSQTVTIDSTCWGSTAEANAFATDTGSSSLAGFDFTVTTDSSTVGAYQYRVTYQNSTASIYGHLYLATSSTYIAGKIVEYDSSAFSTVVSALAVHVDIDDGQVFYEMVDNDDNSRHRNRVRIDGTISDNELTAISDVQGFYNVHQSSSYNVSFHLSYRGDLTNGFVGNYYDSAANSTVDHCALPTDSSASCSGITGISTSLSNGTTLANQTNLEGAMGNLVDYNSAFISFSSVDVTDQDITE